MHKWKHHSGSIHHVLVPVGPHFEKYVSYTENRTRVPRYDLNITTNNFLLFQLDLSLPHYSVAR